MWINRIYLLPAMVWTLQLLILNHPVSGLLHYLAAKRLRLHFLLGVLPPPLLPQDITFQTHRQNVNRGSRGRFFAGKLVNFVWSEQPSRQNTQAANSDMLANLAWSANPTVASNSAHQESYL